MSGSGSEKKLSTTSRLSRLARLHLASVDAPSLQENLLEMSIRPCGRVVSEYDSWRFDEWEFLPARYVPDTDLSQNCPYAFPHAVDVGCVFRGSRFPWELLEAFRELCPTCKSSPLRPRIFLKIIIAVSGAHFAEKTSPDLCRVSSR